jgi:hypothetical protein
MKEGVPEERVVIATQGLPLRIRADRARNFKRLWSPEIDSKEWIPAAYVALAGRYDNPIPPRILAPIESLKIPAQIFFARLRSVAIEYRNICYSILHHL